MITPGLVSVTFRHLGPEEVVSAAAAAGLKSIEWGGDVHVPHGQLARARAVRRMTADAGLAVSAYGSYYRAGAGGSQGPAFEAVLATAAELGAPAVRVWAGAIGSAAADAETRAAVVADLRHACYLAGAASSIRVSLEFHADTLADTADAALGLIAAVDRPNLTAYWQPPNGMESPAARAGLARLLPHVRDLHVFHWWPDHHHRLPLAAGADRWRGYLAAARRDGHPRHASLEFVRGDSLESLTADAATLRQLVGDTDPI